MENASKALIMAGGILIAVLVISVSMYVLSSARGFADAANKEAEASAIASYNRYYESFGPSGTIIWGIDVLNIVNKVLDDNERHTSIRGISLNGEAEDIADAMSKEDGASKMHNPSYKYKYEYTYENTTNNTGYIVSIKITQQP